MEHKTPLWEAWFLSLPALLPLLRVTSIISSLSVFPLVSPGRHRVYTLSLPLQGG